MAKLVNIICLGGRVMADQPGFNLAVEKMDEALKIGEHDLESVVIKNNLMTTFTYIYAKIIDTEKVTDIPEAIISYRPSFNYEIITNKKEIENFLKGM